jgi:hypothetical protein
MEQNVDEADTIRTLVRETRRGQVELRQQFSHHQKERSERSRTRAKQENGGRHERHSFSSWILCNLQSLPWTSYSRHHGLTLESIACRSGMIELSNGVRKRDTQYIRWDEDQRKLR